MEQMPAALRLGIDGCFFQGRYRVLVINENDNRYLEPIYFCNKNETFYCKNLE